MKGVDVSTFNGYVDWQKLKAAGIDFAICRSSYGKKHFDETFQRNVESAHRAGLICGAYHYAQRRCRGSRLFQVVNRK